MPGTVRVITTDSACNQTTTDQSDTVTGIGYTWALSTGASGTGSSLTTNFLTAGTYVCTFTASATNAVCGVVSTNLITTGVVVKVDLDVIHPAGGELTEAAEDSDGGFVAVKRDDDTPVTQLLLRKIEPLALGGQYKVVFSSSKLKVWQNSNGTGAVISDQTTFDAIVTTTLYLEGLSKSASIGAEEISLIWVDSSGGEHDCGEKVNFTVVRAEFDLQAKMWIREQWIDVPIHPIANPLNNKIAGGDDRDNRNDPGASYRVSTVVTVIPFEVLDEDGIKDGSANHIPGLSTLYIREDSLPYPDEEDYSPTNRLLPGATPNDSEPPGTSRMHLDPVTSVDAQIATVRFYGEANDPLIPLSCDIDWDFSVTIDASDPLDPTYLAEGAHDNYPAFEVDLQGQGGARFQPYYWLHAWPSQVSLLCDMFNGLDVTIPANTEGQIP